MSLALLTDGLAPALRVFLHRGAAAHQDAAAARFIGLADAVATADDPGGGKVGPRDDLDKIVDVDVRVADDRDGRIDDLA